MISAEEIKALMAKRRPEYAGFRSSEYEEAANEYGEAILTLQTLLNQAAEDIREARELCDLILGYPPETQIKGAIESKAFDLAHGTIVTLAAITPYLTKEGE